MATNLSQALYNATGASTARFEGDRWADIVNVFDYGALAAGSSHDDYPGVQAAFDAAFGPSSAPHGSSNASLNRPVFFPNGQYSFNTGTPTLTRVVGGHVYGAGYGATVLSKGTGSIIAINGASGLVFERFNLTGGGVNSPLLDIDWDGTAGGGGLNNNIFREILFNNYSIAALIAKSSFDGADNLFELCTFSGNNQTTATGIEARSTSAINNICIAGGAATHAQGYYCSGGSIHLIEPSVAANSYDLRVDSGLPVVVIGGRTESGGFIKLTNGLVTVRGFAPSGTATFLGSISGSTLTVSASGVSGAIANGMIILSSGVANGTRIVSGSALTYTVSVSQTVASQAMSAVQELANLSGGSLSIEGMSAAGIITGAAASFTGSISGSTLTVSGVTGTIAVGQIVTASSTTGITPNTTITAGSSFTWTVNAPQTIGSTAMTSGGNLYLKGNSFGSSAILTQYSGHVSQNI